LKNEPNEPDVVMEFKQEMYGEFISIDLFQSNLLI